MEEKMEVQVKILSNLTVKPSLEPPSHPQTFNLSLLDQIFPVIHIPMLLFYTSPTSTPQQPDLITTLKTSLSQALDKFYPLAGRFINTSTILCNDQGIPFIEAIVINSDLSSLLNAAHKLKLLTQFLPPPEFRALGPQPISEVVLLAFQINLFPCGGVVLGCYFLHKVLDAASFATFLKHWAALATNRAKDLLVQPDFESIIKAFPPVPELENNDSIFVPELVKDNELNENTLPLQPNPITVVAKSFRFSSVSLARLEAMALSQQVPKPTRFETLVGFIWQLSLSAASGPSEEKTTALAFTVNKRPRMSPPFPKESIGNFVLNVKVQSDMSKISVQKLVEDIHSTLSEVNQKITTDYQGENVQEIVLAKWKEDWEEAKQNQELLYRLTSWCKLGLNEADFGFGELVWVVPGDGIQPPAALRNSIFLTDYSDGIEAWIFLEEKEMKILESNPKFLAFTCSN